MRKLSWLFSVLALVALPLWAYFQVSADIAAQREAHEFICGMPIMAIYFLTMVGSCLLSLIALGFGVPAYIRLPLPRSTPRKYELFVLSLPLIASAIVILLVVVTVAGA